MPINKKANKMSGLDDFLETTVCLNSKHSPVRSTDRVGEVMIVCAEPIPFNKITHKDLPFLADAPSGFNKMQLGNKRFLLEGVSYSVITVIPVVSGGLETASSFEVIVFTEEAVKNGRIMSVIAPRDDDEAWDTIL
jgi:hypothetical protein